MLNEGPSGFYKAPATKVIIFVSGGISLVFSLLERKEDFDLKIFPNISSNLQIWRFFTSCIFFKSSFELMFGSILLYYFRTFERRFGSSKFISFAVVNTILSGLIQIAFLVLGKSFGVFQASPGLHGLIYSLFVCYYNDFPVSHQTRVLGVNLSYKSIIYVIGLQLMLSSTPGSVISALSGIISGVLYHSNIGSLQKWRVPQILQKLFDTHIRPLVESSPPVFTSTSTARQRANPSIRHTNLFESFGQGNGETVAPTEENIGILIAMGFQREAALQALTRTNNDVARACNILVDQARSS